MPTNVYTTSLKNRPSHTVAETPEEIIKKIAAARSGGQEWIVLNQARSNGTIGIRIEHLDRLYGSEEDSDAEGAQGS